MLCPKCAREIPDPGPHCPYCSEQLTQPPPLPGPPLPARTSGLAIASLVLGLLGGFIITAILGILFGIIAILQIGHSQGRIRGQGIAIAGTIISGVALLCIPILAAMVFPVFARARASAQKAVCLSNVKNVSLALQMYMADFDDRCPSAATWCDDLEEYVHNSEVFICPAAKHLPCSYAYNSTLSLADLVSFDDPVNTVAIFESDRGWNAAGLPEGLLPPEPRHLGGDNFGYLDGHAVWRSRGAPLRSRWAVD